MSKTTWSNITSYSFRENLKTIMGKKEEKSSFNYKEVEKFVREENKFITDLLSQIDFPKRTEPTEESENDDEREPQKDQITKPEMVKPRAKSLQELQDRLAAITNKKRLSYKEKLIKKGLKNRLKKKSRKEERNSERKLKKAHDLDKKVEEKDSIVEKESKVVFNKEDKMVFSKINLEDFGKKKKKKKEKDPKKLLENIKQQKEMIDKLKAEGKVEKAVEIKEKTAWKNALAKAQGEKIKDDPSLLKKSLKKKEQKQRSSKKKWEQRVKNVEKAKEERQQKRKENIQKKKKEKKTKNLKKAVKKGKVIPGY